MSSFTEEVREIAARFPDARSATLPALRLAQEKHGWLPPKAFHEVADALGLTPAYCQAVASFYDMYHLEPVGVAFRRGVHESLVRCSSALSASSTRSRRSSACVRARRPMDGEVTFRTVECLGGCGYATVVAVDHRYRHDVKPGDVAAIVAEVRR